MPSARRAGRSCTPRSPACRPVPSRLAAAARPLSGARGAALPGGSAAAASGRQPLANRGWEARGGRLPPGWRMVRGRHCGHQRKRSIQVGRARRLVPARSSPGGARAHCSRAAAAACPSCQPPQTPGAFTSCGAQHAPACCCRVKIRFDDGDEGWFGLDGGVVFLGKRAELDQQMEPPAGRAGKRKQRAPQRVVVAAATRPQVPEAPAASKGDSGEEEDEDEDED